MKSQQFLFFMLLFTIFYATFANGKVYRIILTAIYI